MDKRKVIIISAFLFSFIFTAAYYALFSLSTTSDGEAMTLYMNQVGLYREKENVEDMQAKLQQDGLASYTLAQGDKVAVMCGVSCEQAKTQEVQKTLKDKQYSFIEKSVTIQDEKLLKLLEEEKYQEVLERMTT